jgi:hypothetical protein
LNLNFKLYFKYILFYSNQVFLKYIFRNDKNNLILISQNNLYYLTLHFKLSSIFYSTQLIDIFSYETPLNTNQNKINNKELSKYNMPLLNNSIMVYNFHSLLFQQRFFIFVINLPTLFYSKKINKLSSFSSITELFLNAN